MPLNISCFCHEYLPKFTFTETGMITPKAYFDRAGKQTRVCRQTEYFVTIGVEVPNVCFGTRRA